MIPGLEEKSGTFCHGDWTGEYEFRPGGGLAISQENGPISLFYTLSCNGIVTETAYKVLGSNGSARSWDIEVD